MVDVVVSTLRILLVDDEEIVLRGVARALRCHDVTEVTDPRVALGLVESGAEFDVVVSDYHMPGLNGVELLGRIAEHDPSIAGVLLTGTTDLAAAIEAVNAGCIARFLTKPVTAQCLREVIGEVVEQHSARRKADLAEQAAALAAMSESMVLAYRVETQRLVREGFDMRYQPIVELGSGRALGAEALSAFEGGSPETVFLNARRAGMDTELQHRAIDLALRAIPAFPSGIRLWLNISPDCVNDQLVGLLEPWVESITLELTESTRILDHADLSTRLAPLRSAGAHVAIDDVGTGYSCLGHIAALQPEYIKLDRSLVSDLAADPIRQQLIEALQSFGRQTGTLIVAEGVETAAERATLLELGVRHAQGYFFCRPQPWSRRLLVDRYGDDQAVPTGRRVAPG